MINWMKEHIIFIERISLYILKMKGLNVNAYIEIMTNAGQPLDEIAVVTIARFLMHTLLVLHIHIGIIMDSHYWTSRRDHNLSNCKILLGWQGQLNFVDIKWKDKSEIQFYNLRKP